MNSQGRHYRDQTDPTNLVCDYESKGQKCEFYDTNEDFAHLQKIFPKYGHVGTLNLCLETPDSLEKELIWFVQYSQRKRPKYVFLD